MNDASSRLADHAVALRRAFDRSFAEPARPDPTPMTDLLAFRAGSQAYALYLAEISGLYAGKKITRVPSHAAALLGIAGFRGALVPVYSVAAFLGHASPETPRWLVGASAAPIAFAFEAFDFHVRVTRAAILPRGAGDHASPYVQEFLRARDLVRPIVRLAAILDAIMNQTPEPVSGKER
jgi:purine-binding chemotaxis protein CheW